MHFEIQPVSPEDAPKLSPVMMRAFHRIPHWALLWSGMPLEEIIAGNTQRLPRNLINGRDKKRHQKAVDPVTGEIVGYARWIIPDDGSIDWPEAQVPEPSTEDWEIFEASFKEYTVDGKIKGLNYEITDSVNPDLDVADEEILKDGPYLTLDYICTTPEYQGKGVARTLLQSGIKIAETAGLRMYVMSTPPGLKLYENHGFKRVKTITHDYSKWGSTELHVNYFLIRDVAR